MYLDDATPGTFLKRCYKGENIVTDYIISISLNRKLRYYNRVNSNRYEASSPVRANSGTLDHNDFEYCDQNGELIKEIKMVNKENDVNYIGGDYQIVEVSYTTNTGEFPTIHSYYFKCDIDIEVTEGDLMVVESKRGLGIVGVIKCFTNCLENAEIVKKATAWIVCKIDYSRQKARKEATERRVYVIQQLEEKKQQMDAINMYALLAETDKDAAKLLEELKTLGGTK